LATFSFDFVFDEAVWDGVVDAFEDEIRRYLVLLTSEDLALEFDFEDQGSKVDDVFRCTLRMQQVLVHMITPDLREHLVDTSIVELPEVLQNEQARIDPPLDYELELLEIERLASFSHCL